MAGKKESTAASFAQYGNERASYHLPKHQ